MGKVSPYPLTPRFRRALSRWLEENPGKKSWLARKAGCSRETIAKMLDPITTTSEFRNAVAAVIGVDPVDFYTQEEREVLLLELLRDMPEEAREAVMEFARKTAKKR